MKIRKEHIGFIVILCLIAMMKFFYHELWKDEWQSWLVARDMSIGKLFSFLNYEGHPSLYYLWLKPFTLLSSLVREDLLINISHLLLVGVALYILFIKMQMPFYIKLMLGISYFIGFEYGVVNRGYVIVILLALMAVYYIKSAQNYHLGISLFLLCQTEVYGVLLAMTLLLFYYLKNRFADWIPYAFVGGGLVLFLLTIYPRDNAEDFSRAYNKVITTHSVADVFQGNLANVFAIGLINDTATVGYSAFGIVLSILLLALTIYIFSNSREIQTFWIVGIGILMTFGILIYSGGVRQWGMLFILFTLCIELNSSVYKDRFRMAMIILLLICPIAHNVKAIANDFALPFSNAKETGLFIQKEIPNNVAIVAINKFETAPVAAYANRKFFELPSGTPFTYFKWLERVYIPTQSELILFTKFKKAKGIVVITHEPIDPQRFPLLKLWKKFDKENFKSEEYYIYLMQLS
jgi:hypothetical protein